MKTESAARWGSATQTDRSDLLNGNPTFSVMRDQDVDQPLSYLLIGGGVDHDILLLTICCDNPSW